jgi:hypothetical protein
MRWWIVRGAVVAAMALLVSGGPVSAQQVYRGADRGGTWLYIPDAGGAPGLRRPPADMQPLNPRYDRPGYQSPRYGGYQDRRPADGWRQAPSYGYGNPRGYADRQAYDRPRYDGQRRYRSDREEGRPQYGYRYRPPAVPRSYAAGRVYLVPLAGDQPIPDAPVVIERPAIQGVGPAL